MINFLCCMVHLLWRVWVGLIGRMVLLINLEENNIVNTPILIMGFFFIKSELFELVASGTPRLVIVIAYNTLLIFINMFLLLVLLVECGLFVRQIPCLKLLYYVHSYILFLAKNSFLGQYWLSQ